MAKVREVREKVRWDDTMYVTCYELARQGSSDTEIAHTLGVTSGVFKKWAGQKPALGDALARAREGVNSEGFTGYVYKRLPGQLKRAWDRLQRLDYDESDLAATGSVKAALKQVSKRGRQHLFLHALVQCNWNVSEACGRVGISTHTYKKWCDNDADFSDLLAEFHTYKKDYYESALVKLVGKGNSAAVIFANKTQNRDRGYGDTVVHEHTGSVQHNHTVISITSLNLPDEVKAQLLEAMREQISSEPVRNITMDPNGKEVIP